MQAGTYLLSTAYTPTRIMGILAGDEEQTGVTQDSATAADTAAQTDTQTTDAGTDTADTRVQMVQQILRQLMELQGKESPDSDRRGEKCALTSILLIWGNTSFSGRTGKRAAVECSGPCNGKGSKQNAVWTQGQHE